MIASHRIRNGNVGEGEFLSSVIVNNKCRWNNDERANQRTNAEGTEQTKYILDIILVDFNMENSHINSTKESSDTSDHDNDTDVIDEWGSCSHNNCSRNGSSKYFLIPDSSFPHQSGSNECSDNAPKDSEEDGKSCNIISLRVAIILVVNNEARSEDKSGNNKASSDLGQEEG